MEQLEGRNYDVATALLNIAPGTKWAVESNSYEGIRWYSEPTLKPSKEDVTAEVARLKSAWQNSEYQRLREKEYPPITDYLDAVVKGDLAQQQAYINACLAVKEKYPKPEEV